ncbi:MAG: hypothetical protein AAGA86_02365 [Bacteroidota bacterium]
MTLEIIVFIFAILFGIVWYWRESHSNKLYRWVNALTHSKELQMKPDNKKGFIHGQPFLLRLVWITLFFAISTAIISWATPISAFYVQYFVSAIVGTLIGTYLASAVLFAKEKTSRENLEKVFEKGKDFVEDLTEGDEKPKEAPQEAQKPEPEAPPKKSARERFKDKGMIK